MWKRVMLALVAFWIGVKVQEWREARTDAVDVGEWDETETQFGDLMDWSPHLQAVEEQSGATLTRRAFLEEYVIKGRPVVIRGATRGNNEAFKEAVRKRALVQKFGNVELTLSTANTQSYDKVVLALREYVVKLMGPQDESKSGVETLYQFGDHSEGSAIQELLRLYQLPLAYINATDPYALSFGMSGSGTGVPWHTHGPVVAEVFFGRKRWFISQPGVGPRFNGSETVLHWWRRVLPTLQNGPVIYSTICEKGDLLWLPPQWWHSTLNLGQTIFMSTFV